MAILDGTSTLSGSDQDNFISTALGPYIDAAAAQASLVGGGALPRAKPASDTCCRNAGVRGPDARSTASSCRRLAQALGLATATASILLTEWFPSASTPGSFLITDFLAIANAALADTTAAGPAQQPGIRAAVHRLRRARQGGADHHEPESPRHRRQMVARTVGVAAELARPDHASLALQAAADGRCYRLCLAITATTVRNKIPLQGATFARLFGAASGATKSALPQRPRRHDPMADCRRSRCSAATRPAKPTGELSLTYPEDYATEIALVAAAAVRGDHRPDRHPRGC